jgi:hypothetical protein
MKNLLKMGLFIGLVILFMVGTLSAASVTYIDNADHYANWPGHFIFASDEYGNPQVSSITVNTNDNGYLLSVLVHVANQIPLEQLFINVNYDHQNYEDWDYFISSQSDPYNPIQATMYSVADNYQYTYATQGRIGHPNGIEEQYLTPVQGILSSFSAPLLYGTGDVIYTFTQGTIFLGNNYVIGFTEDCANDVALTTPVAEPSLLLLLGSGLLGLVTIKKKRWFK